MLNSVERKDQHVFVSYTIDYKTIAQVVVYESYNMTDGGDLLTRSDGFAPLVEWDNRR